VEGPRFALGGEIMKHFKWWFKPLHHNCSYLILRRVDALLFALRGKQPFWHTSDGSCALCAKMGVSVVELSSHFPAWVWFMTCKTRDWLLEHYIKATLKEVKP
jgi:hypothetical protein